MEGTATVTVTLEADGPLQLTLRDEGGLFRWYYPDGSKTSLARTTQTEAIGAMGYCAARLAREYLACRHVPLPPSHKVATGSAELKRAPTSMSPLASSSNIAFALAPTIACFDSLGISGVIHLYVATNTGPARDVRNGITPPSGARASELAPRGYSLESMPERTLSAFAVLADI